MVSTSRRKPIEEGGHVKEACLLASEDEGDM